MVAVIFEAVPHAEQWDVYLELAGQLRPELQKMKGFVSVERFQSLTEPSKVLSLSFWEDEASVAAWRGTEMHREAQAEGRRSVFEDYRIRVAAVVRDYGLKQRTEAPNDSRSIHQ